MSMEIDWQTLSRHRARQKKLGPRQVRLLAAMRRRPRGSADTTADLARMTGYPHNPNDVEYSLLGLVVRGLVERTTPRREAGRHGTDRWCLTEAGRTVPLPATGTDRRPVQHHFLTVRHALDYAVGMYRTSIRMAQRFPSEAALAEPWALAIARALPELAGRDLACWCPTGDHPCHADVLLELANGGAG